MDLYPRYTITDAAGVRLGLRVSREAGRAITETLAVERQPFALTEHKEPPRFRIKVATWPTDNPIVLADSVRPAFRGQYRTLEAACAAMDNTIRRERNMPARIGGLAEATKRYLDAKAERDAALVNAPCTVEPLANGGVLARGSWDAAPIVPPAPDGRHHVGQHVQGCRACYAYTEGRVAGHER
jgi:hypothetical protein